MGMTKLEEIALAIFRKVSGDPEASWETMSAEERDDAMGLARSAQNAAFSLFIDDGDGQAAA